MKKVVLIRHGESVWNLENRFTGWTDVDLTRKGIIEAQEAADLLKDNGFVFGRAYTSYLKRAIKTLNLMLDGMDLAWIPVEKSWRLNEKHYGVLQGLNKRETAKKFGESQVQLWRRSYEVAPPPLDEEDPRCPRFDPRYHDVKKLPLTESLRDAEHRALVYWHRTIVPSVTSYDATLVVAHGNSLRGIIHYLKNWSTDEILRFNLPTGIPYVIEFDGDMNLINDYFLGDKEEIDRKLIQIVNQIKV